MFCFNCYYMLTRLKGSNLFFRHQNAWLRCQHCLLVITHKQCDQIWQIFATFGKSLKVFGKFLTFYFLFGKMLSLLWQSCEIIWLIFIGANNNLIIWLHCWHKWSDWQRGHFNHINKTDELLNRSVWSSSFGDWQLGTVKWAIYDLFFVLF